MEDKDSKLHLKSGQWHAAVSAEEAEEAEGGLGRREFTVEAEESYVLVKEMEKYGSHGSRRVSRISGGPHTPPQG